MLAHLLRGSRARIAASAPPADVALTRPEAVEH
jgi:hypothetical protein